MKIFFAVLAVILLIGMLAESDRDSRRNFTYGFIATIIGIVALS